MNIDDLKFLIISVFVYILMVNPTSINGQSIDKIQSFSGNYDFVIIGGTTNVKDDCNYNTTSQAKLSLPTGAKIKFASLYWSGSSQPDKYGPFIDDDVNLNGRKVIAEKTWTESRRAENKILHYYGAYADVTSRISRPGLLKISDLWWNNVFACPFDAAYGGWSLLVVYEHPANPYKDFSIFEGLEFVGPNKHIIHRFEDLNIPSCESYAQISMVTWDGKSDISEKLILDKNEISENLIGAEDSDFHAVVVELPELSFRKNAIFETEKSVEDDFIVQYFVLDHIVCNETCQLEVPNDTMIFCTRDLDLSNIGQATADCDVEISYQDIVTEACPKIIDRTWIGTPVQGDLCQEVSLVKYSLNCTSSLNLRCEEGGVAPSLNPNVCPEIIASNICRDSDENSCAYRLVSPDNILNVPDAVCTGGWKNSKWKEDNKNSIVFSVKFDGSEVGCITSLSLYEVAMAKIIQADTIYVRNWGLVVRKNGEEIYRNTSLETSLEWTEQRVSFDGLIRVLL